ncbi:hypothetical protein MMIC_P0197 [Mariprofundus micogutta]|uniref:Uncharacterized protein n=1 Tax=Mariprofundus micogutta TaxID=1921010 RepID=A0A1L8CK10_9PROT|nr:hypothetical protein MMIC_P0197 [Mariprofundus micogutta]
MDAVELGVLISMIGVLAILIYGAIWFFKVINSKDDK